MSSIIYISDLRLAGSDLLSGAESYLDFLVEDNSIYGGAVRTTPVFSTKLCIMTPPEIDMTIPIPAPFSFIV
jgi:hypothetical protein